MTPGFAKTKSELPRLYYPRNDRVIINAHNFTPPAPTLNRIITSTPPTATRNNFSGTIGYRFVATSSFSLLALGRWVGTIFAGSHLVAIYSDAGTLLRSVTITTGSAADGAGWRYELLSSALSIVSGTAYRVGVTETSGGDNWQDTRSSTGVFDAAYIGTIDSYYHLSQNSFPNTLANSGQIYAYTQLYR